MSFLLDTNVISELRKPAHRATDSVHAWAAAQPTHELWISVITVMEIEIGVARLHRRDPDRSTVLRRWLENELLEAFDGRVLPVDLEVARRAAQLHVPDPRPERDVLIAASALTRNLIVATRNIADFGHLGVNLHNPWDE